MTVSLHLAKLSLNRDKLVSSGRSELAGDVERELASIQAQAQQIDALPLLGVSSKSTSGNDDFAAMMGLEANQSTQTEDAGVNLKRELNNLLSRYPAELKRTQACTQLSSQHRSRPVTSSLRPKKHNKSTAKARTDAVPDRVESAL